MKTSGVIFLIYKLGEIYDTEFILYQLEKKENSDFVIRMLDMENAFDREEWNLSFKVSKCFHFEDLLLVVQTCEMQHHA